MGHPWRRRAVVTGMGSVRNGSAGYSSVEGGPAGDSGRVRDGGRVGGGPARGDMGDYGSVGRGSARHSAGPQRPAYLWLLLRLAGAGLLAATAAIHLDLYLTGYRTIPTIGWLFLAHVISG